MLFVEANYGDDDDGVIDVSVTSRNHGDHSDDVRDEWRHSSRHHRDYERGMINWPLLCCVECSDGNISNNTGNDKLSYRRDSARCR